MEKKSVAFCSPIEIWSGQEGPLCFLQAESNFCDCCFVLEVFPCHAICHSPPKQKQLRAPVELRGVARSFISTKFALLRCRPSSYLVIHFAGCIRPGLGASKLLRTIRQYTGAGNHMTQGLGVWVRVWLHGFVSQLSLFEDADVKRGFYFYYFLLILIFVYLFIFGRAVRLKGS